MSQKIEGAIKLGELRSALYRSCLDMLKERRLDNIAGMYEKIAEIHLICCDIDAAKNKVREAENARHI